MRADIHGGPEQKLQSEAGYIDARPQTDSSTKTSCNARPDHTYGSKGEILTASRYFPICPQDQTWLEAAVLSVSCQIGKSRSRRTGSNRGRPETGLRLTLEVLLGEGHRYTF